VGVIVNLHKKIFDFFSYIIIKKPYITALGVFIIGLFFLFFFELTMNKDTWFWFFSTTAQTFAALIALAAVFLIFKLELYNIQIRSKFDHLAPLIKDTFDEDTYHVNTSDKLLKESFDDIRPRLNPYVVDLFDKVRKDLFDIEQKKEKFKKNFKELFVSSLIIVMCSLILLPLGSVSSENIFILYIWDSFKLKWFFIYLFVGYCIVVLVRLTLRLSEFFDEDG
jgi:uncharacterized membrane protein YqjE